VHLDLDHAEARRELERFAAEQRVLRQAAILVASGASPGEVFAAITTSASELFGVPFASILRYGADETATMVAGCAACSQFVGQTWIVPGDDPGVVRTVVASRRPARIEDHSGVHGPLGAAASALGIGSVVAAPVIVDGSVWGVLAVGAARDGPPLPADAGDRLVGFAELVATTLINSEARDEVRSLMDEQETLRRVAPLIAQGASPDEVFVAVCDEAVELLGAEQAAVARLEVDRPALVTVGLSTGLQGATIGMRSALGDWPTTSTACRTGRIARTDVSAEETAGTGAIPNMVRAKGFLSTISAPIVVDGHVWGALTVSDSRHALEPSAERRIENFTELIATAIASREAREALAVSEARARTLANEQAALRRVATLAARESSPVEILEAVAKEAARVLAVDAIGILRFEPGETATLVAQSATPWDPPPLGTSFTLDGENVVASVHRTGQVGRMDDWESATGSVAAMATVLGVRSAVAAPIVVQGRAWGTMVAATNQSMPLPADTESRIVEFAELLATAISNAESREALTRLADEQAALRRVATLVATGTDPHELFSAVSEEVARLFKADSASVGRFEPDGSRVVAVGRSKGLRGIPIGTRADVETSPTLTEVHRTRRAARWSDNFYSSVAAPIMVGGSLWGVLEAGSGRAGLPPDTEERLEKFGELVTTAIANAQGRDELAASETRKSAILEWALDCIVTINHEGTILEFNPAAEATFGYRREDVVGMEMAKLIIPPSLREQHYRGLERYLKTREGPVVRKRVELKALRSDGTEFPVELTVTPITMADPPMFTAYIRDITERKQGEEERARLFEGERAARAEAEAATERAQHLAREQAALRRVATLVAEGTDAEEVFSAVAREVSRVLGVRGVTVDRYESDGASVFSVVLASLEDPTFPVGSRWPLDGPSLRGSIYETGQPGRMEDWSGIEGTVAAAVRNQGMRWAVAAPIVVDGTVWGNICAGTTGGERIPEGAENRLARFTELLSTAVTNATMRSELAASEARAREVAQGVGPDELFSAVADEVAGIIDIPVVGVNRYEADGTFTTLGIAGETNFTVGSRWPVEDKGLAGKILSTGRSAWSDDYARLAGRLGDAVREDQLISAVGVPIVVDGIVWGFMVAAAKPGRPIPADTEERLVRFTELVATAVSNATTRADLLRSRARLVSTADETRRRLERDLHDGIQQWLVGLALRARKAAGLSAAGESPLQELTGLADDLVAVTDELREISRGIHPAILSDSGLDDALAALARRSAIRVELDVAFQRRYDPTLEATVYYVVAESITNAVKHAQASAVAVRGGLRGESIELEIRDDGIGGANPRRGTGMVGLRDRVDTLGGTISFASPAGAGTTIRVRLPASPHDEGPPPPLTGAHEAASAPTSG
jgi:PAS domain S-box-containing protein